MDADSTDAAPALSSIATRDADALLRAEIVRLCVTAHDEPDFENLFDYLPEDGLHVVASDGARLVGHAVVTTRWLQPGSLPPLRTAYVDAVAVPPSHQRLGVGSAVMQHLATLLDGYEIACLETDRNPFFRRLGWEEWRGALAGRSAGGLIPTPDQTGIMILRLPATPSLDLDDLLTIEATDARIW